MLSILVFLFVIDETSYDKLPTHATSLNVLINGISTLNLDPDSIKKCQAIIKNIKSKPFSCKLAILKYRKKPQVKKKPTTKM